MQDPWVEVTKEQKEYKAFHLKKVPKNALHFDKTYFCRVSMNGIYSFK